MNIDVNKICIVVIVVNWNTKDLLRKCLRSIYSHSAGMDLKFIVVDNGSYDGSVEMVKGEFPDIALIENENNLGFAKANNQAFKLVRRDHYVLLINTDIIFKKDSVRKMIDFLSSHSEVGAVGPALRLPNGQLQTGAAGFGPSIRTAFNYFFFLSLLWPRIFKGLFINQKKYIKWKAATNVDWVAGACMLVRSEVIHKIGGLDESYFMYAEDAEWCERIKRNGWKVFYLPNVEVIHHHGASGALDTNKSSAQWLRALIKYVQTRYGFRKTFAFRLIAILGLWFRFIFYFLFFISTGYYVYWKKSQKMFIFIMGALCRGR